MNEHYKKILFCTDFSIHAKHAFAYALRVALRNPGVTLILLHVIPEPDAQFWKGYIYEVGDMDAKARADIDQRVDTDYRSHVPPEVAFEVVIKIGDAAQSILAYAREQAVDLVVLGRQGQNTFAQWLLGNVAGKVARKSSCPVLIVPPKESESPLPA